MAAYIYHSHHTGKTLPLTKHQLRRLFEHHKLSIRDVKARLSRGEKIDIGHATIRRNPLV